MKHNDVEAALRASLAEHARHAPTGDGLIDDIVTAAERQPNRPLTSVRRVGTWSLPLFAAAAVAVIAASIGLIQTHPWASGPAPAANPSSPAAPTNSAHSSPSRPASSTHPSVAPNGPGVSSSPVDPSGLTHFQVTDLTWASATQGWALGSAQCLTAPTQVCTAMVRTIDGGKSWHKVENPPVNVPGVSMGCSPSTCATHIRYANSRVGYAFGAGDLQMTIDGGLDWTHIAGGACALETLGGNVIRVLTDNPSGCSFPGGTFTVEVAPIGVDAWQPTHLPALAGSMSTGLAFGRTGTDAYLEIFGRPAGGSQTAGAALYVSTNDGTSWTNVGEPCPQEQHGPSNGQVDSAAFTTAPDGSVTALCLPRGGDREFTATSPAGGKGFHADGRPLLVPGGGADLIAASSAKDLFVMTGSLQRSTNGGRTWQAASAAGPAPTDVTWIGFENSNVGRAVSPPTAGHGSTIWTTHNAGLTWTAYTFR
jgi:hypothetical protein